ncbi:MAG: hypothetical protein ACLPWG_00535 [Steroidobacteraceae bacterium]
MKTIAFQVHKAWLIPAVLVLVVTCLIYAIVGSIAKNPFPWIMVIPGSLPLSMYFFVGRPLLKKEKQNF